MARANTLIREANPTTYAQCRSLGHEWRHKGRTDQQDPSSVLWGAIGLVSQCADCKTRRVKWVTRSGEVSTRYEYPEGYSTHGEERRTLREWRVSYVTTLFEDAA